MQKSVTVLMCDLTGL